VITGSRFANEASCLVLESFKNNNNNNNNPICKAPECQKTSVALKDFRGVLVLSQFYDSTSCGNSCKEI